MIAFAEYTYQKRFVKVLDFVVMGTSEDFLHLTTHYAVYKIMSVCMCLKQQTDDLYIIICVVINPLSKSVALQVGRSGFIR